MQSAKIYLKQKQQVAELKQITSPPIDQVIVLEERIYKNLAPDQKSFIVPKTEEDYNKMIQRPKDAVFGLFIEGTQDLIAVSGIICPNSGDGYNYLDAFTLTDPDKSSVLIATKVMEEYRGNNAQKYLTAAREAWMVSQNRIYAYSEVDARNHHSWGNLVKLGYTISGRNEIIENGQIVPLYLASKNLNAQTIAEPDIYKSLTMFYDQEKELFRDGYDIVSYDLKQNRIGLTQRSHS